MKRIALPFSVLALAGLAACTTEPYVAPAPVVSAPAPARTVVVTPATTAPVVVPQTAVLRTGSGRIDAISLVPGGSATAASRRINVRMDDGTQQLVDLDATGLALGDRIEFLSDGYFRRAAAPAAPVANAYRVTVPPASTALRPGFGNIESVAAIPGSAAAGASASPLRRMSVRMSDGSLQYIETDVPGLDIGDRIELTSEGYLRRP